VDSLQRGDAGKAGFVLGPLIGSLLQIPWKKGEPAIVGATSNDPVGLFNVARSRLRYVPHGQVPLPGSQDR